MDPEIAVQLLAEDEGLTSDLDEPDALSFLAALAGLVRQQVPRQPNAATWLEQVRPKARQLAAIVVAVRSKRLADAQQLARTHGFRWPTKLEELIPQLVAQLGTCGG